MSNTKELGYNIRVITAKEITQTVKSLCIEANKKLPSDISNAVKYSMQCERNQRAKSVLSDMLDNVTIADQLNIPICQDTGMAVVLADIGQDLHITGGSFIDAVNEGVRQGYTEGLLRYSIVADPINRVNTGDNTPAIVHTRIVSGDKLTITVAPKGFGSENMSRIKMFEPSATVKEIEEFIVDVVRLAGGNPCPPVVVGVGIGGDFEYSAIMAKRALCGDISNGNPDPFYNDMEKRLLQQINLLNIGPQGFSGDTTALAVSILTHPTHIAGLPVAVNIGCHVTRHKTAVI